MSNLDLSKFLSTVGQDLSKLLTATGVDTVFLRELFTGKKTFFLPSAASFASLPASATGTDVIQTLKYHTVEGLFPAASIPAGTTPVATVLGPEVKVNKDAKGVSVDGASNRVNVVTPDQYRFGNLVVHGVDGFLKIPVAPAPVPNPMPMPVPTPAPMPAPVPGQGGLSGIISSALAAAGLNRAVNADGTPSNLTVLPVVFAGAPASAATSGGMGWFFWLVIIVLIVLVLWFMYKKGRESGKW